MSDIKGIPRHTFGEDGAYTELDTCGVQLGSKLVVVSEIGKAIVSTTFVRTPPERGALHDWQLEDDNGAPRVQLAHQRNHKEGGQFIDRSVILKVGNEVSYDTWDARDGAAVYLGRIIGMDILHPYETAEAAATIQFPLGQNRLLDVAA